MSNDRAAPDLSYSQLQAQMPSMVKTALPRLPWNKEKLWALDLPVHEVDIRLVEHLLKLPIWQLDGKRFQVRPNDVLANPEKYHDHYQRILKSDLNYPIHVISQDDILTILDGFHRVTKAIVEGNTTVQAMELSQSDLVAISTISPK